MPVPVISVSQMRDWERATWNSGQTEAEVIQQVGRRVAQVAVRLTRAGDRILILAGKGNNGADARISRDHIHDRLSEVLEVRNPSEDLAKFKALTANKPALLIDGLFGIGLDRPLDSSWIRFIEAVSAAQIPVLAVDVPSGLDAETGKPQGAAVEAEVTLTVGASKHGLLRPSADAFVGRLEVAADVGLVECPFSSELNWTCAEDFAGFPPVRSVASHKGSFGHLAIVAGSAGYHGAAVLSARGAQRARPGLITLYPDASAYPGCAAQLQAVMVQPWSKRVESLAGLTGWLAGPGLASPELSDAMKQSIRELWKTAPIPMVVDASALAWLPPGGIPGNAIRVITPHPGEAARLLNKSSQEVQADRLSSLRELSGRFGDCWVVLKGHQTLVGRGVEKIFVNSSGNPYLAQGGSGDLLAGYLAGLLAQPALQPDALKTIRYAVWQHGATADRLQFTKPNWVVEDLAAALGGEVGTAEASGVEQPS